MKSVEGKLTCEQFPFPENFVIFPHCQYFSDFPCRSTKNQYISGIPAIHLWNENTRVNNL